jgi:putative restriction endonuclease
VPVGSRRPLLVLYALGQLSRGGPSAVAFREVAPKLTELLKEFGPSRQTYHPEYPFWRLQNDGVWVVDRADQLQRRTGQTDVPKRELLERDVRGHFTSEIAEQQLSDPGLVTEIASRLLHGHFSETLHQDILDAVGLDVRLTETVTRLRRDPEFRYRVLAAYDHSCAVCGFDVRLGTAVLAVEAAHIQWYQTHRPDEERNGLALCSLHHRAFDRGAFTVRPDRVLLVSGQAHRRQGFGEWLMQFHGQPIRTPRRQEDLPAEEFPGWHQRKVLRRPPRQIASLS